MIIFVIDIVRLWQCSIFHVFLTASATETSRCYSRVHVCGFAIVVVVIVVAVVTIFVVDIVQLWQYSIFHVFVTAGAIETSAEAVVYDQPNLHSCTLPFFVSSAFLHTAKCQKFLHPQSTKRMLPKIKKKYCIITLSFILYQICTILGSRMFMICNKSKYTSGMFSDWKFSEMVHPGWAFMTVMFSYILCIFCVPEEHPNMFLLGFRMFVIYEKSKYSSDLFYDWKILEMIHPKTALVNGMFSCIPCTFFLQKEHPHMFFSCHNVALAGTKTWNIENWHSHMMSMTKMIMTGTTTMTTTMMAQPQTCTLE
jgi:hypothetical protein